MHNKRFKNIIDVSFKDDIWLKVFGIYLEKIGYQVSDTLGSYRPTHLWLNEDYAHLTGDENYGDSKARAAVCSLSMDDVLRFKLPEQLNEAVQAASELYEVKTPAEPIADVVVPEGAAEPEEYWMLSYGYRNNMSAAYHHRTSVASYHPLEYIRDLKKESTCFNDYYLVWAYPITEAEYNRWVEVF